MQMQSENIGELVAAIASVVAEVGFLETDASNSFHRYSYLSDEALLLAVRGPMATHGLAILPSDVDSNIREVKTAKGKAEVLVTTTTTFVIAHKSGQWMKIQVLAMGQDSGDKGPYKAATGAMKYAIRQVFLIATGDDPEKAAEVVRKQEKQRELTQAEREAKAKGHSLWWHKGGNRWACAQLGEVGLKYEEVAAWTEARGWKRPSGWPETKVRALVAALITPNHERRRDFDGWLSAQRGAA